MKNFQVWYDPVTNAIDNINCNATTEFREKFKPLGNKNSFLHNYLLACEKRAEMERKELEDSYFYINIIFVGSISLGLLSYCVLTIGVKRIISSTFYYFSFHWALKLIIKYRNGISI